MPAKVPQRWQRCDSGAVPRRCNVSTAHALTMGLTRSRPADAGASGAGSARAHQRRSPHRRARHWRRTSQRGAYHARRGPAVAGAGEREAPPRPPCCRTTSVVAAQHAHTHAYAAVASGRLASSGRLPSAPPPPAASFHPLTHPSAPSTPAPFNPQSPKAILDRAASALSEYRSHKAAVGPWLRSFAASHAGRRPALADARATGDADLAARYQKYLDVRKRLMAEIPMLRDEYEKAAEEDARSRRRGGVLRPAGAAAGVPGANANTAAVRSPAAAAQQWAAAAEYRRAHPVRPAAAGGSSEATAVPATAVAPAAAAAAPVSITGVVPAAGLAAAAGPRLPAAQQLAGDGVSGGAARLAEKAAAGGGDPAARMRSAALAALQYKSRKAGAAGAANAGARRGGAASAVLQADVPPPPKAGEPAVIAVVETARFNAYSGRRARDLDADVRLDVVMADGPAPAVTAGVTGDAGGAAGAGAADVGAGAAAAAAPAVAKPQPQQQQPQAARRGAGGGAAAEPRPPLVLPGAVPLPT